MPTPSPSLPPPRLYSDVSKKLLSSYPGTLPSDVFCRSSPYPPLNGWFHAPTPPTLTEFCMFHKVKKTSGSAFGKPKIQILAFRFPVEPAATGATVTATCTKAYSRLDLIVVHQLLLQLSHRRQYVLSQYIGLLWEELGRPSDLSPFSAAGRTWLYLVATPLVAIRCWVEELLKAEEEGRDPTHILRDSRAFRKAYDIPNFFQQMLDLSILDPCVLSSSSKSLVSIAETEVLSRWQDILPRKDWYDESKRVYEEWCVFLLETKARFGKGDMAWTWAMECLGRHSAWEVLEKAFTMELSRLSPLADKNDIDPPSYPTKDSGTHLGAESAVDAEQEEGKTVTSG